MKARLWIAAAVAYAVMGVLTFGYAAAHNEREQAARCRSKPDSSACYGLDDIPAMSGLMAGLMWPLYVSWEAWS